LVSEKESKIMGLSSIKSIDIRYYRDDGLYYLSWTYQNNLRRSIFIDDNFFDTSSYISAHERLKIECPELTEKEIDKILEKVLAY
jgi:TFIIF-interacting CTD phosphatase-like protein